MPSWIAVDAGLIYLNILPSGITIKVVKNSGSCLSSFQRTSNLVGLCQKYNPQLSLSDLAITKVIRDSFSEPSGLQIVDNSLNLSTTLENMGLSTKFKWQFNLEICVNAVDEIFKPIFTSMMLLIEEKKTLESLMRKKDKEIAEFLSLGITLSKKSRISAPYDPDKVLENVKSQHQTTAHILSDSRFQECIAKSSKNNSNSVSTTISPVKKKKHIVPQGIRFEDSFSQETFDADNLKLSDSEGDCKQEFNLHDSNSGDSDKIVPSASNLTKKRKKRRL